MAITNNGTNAQVIELPEAKKPSRHREERIKIPNMQDAEVQIQQQHGWSKFKLCDVSSFGLRVQPIANDSLLICSETVMVRVELGAHTIYSGKCKVINENGAEDKISYGLSIIEGLIDLEHVRAIVDGKEIKPKISSTLRLIEHFKDVDPNFKAYVADLNALLNDLEKRFDEEEERIKNLPFNSSHKKRIEETTIDIAWSLYSQTLSELFGKLETTVRDFSNEQHAVYKRYFRSNFSRMVFNTPFFKRAFEKPLGYAGDYGLMVMFYNYEDLGERLFYKFLHRWACNQPAAVANKNRTGYLASSLQDIYEKSRQLGTSKHFKVSSIACGPAQEIFMFVNETNFDKEDNINLVLIDQEEKALEWATKNIKLIGNPKCKLDLWAYQEDAVLGIIKEKPFTQDIDGSNVIISAGLFDYLSDRISSRLISSLYKKLAPGGEIFIGNVSDQNPDRFAMDYLMDWNLILRGPDDLVRLVPEDVSNHARSVSVASESLGLNLFLRISKPG